MSEREAERAEDLRPEGQESSLAPLQAAPFAVPAALGNQAVARIAQGFAGAPRAARAILGSPRGAPARGVIGRQVAPAAGVVDAGVSDASLPGGVMAPPPEATHQRTPADGRVQGHEPEQTAATAAPPDRDAIIRTAIDGVLQRYQNLAILVPLRQPRAPGTRAPAGAAEEPPLAGPPQQVTFNSPYFINRAGGGDGGRAGGRGGLDRPGVRSWFNGLRPNAVRVGKGSPDELQAAMQQAVDLGLLNDTWPPTRESLHQFMRDTGLGVDCSGFVYLALEAANTALVAAGLPGLTTPTPTTIGNTSSQALGRGGGTQIRNPADLRAGDIVQMAPHGTHTVGHVRILTNIRVGPDFVEYDTAESTTRVGHGPQGSTWRIPAGGPMDVAHLEVRNDTTGAWTRETTGRPTTYWRRLSTAAAAPTTAAGEGAARSVARTRSRDRSVRGAQDAAVQRGLARTAAARGAGERRAIARQERPSALARAQQAPGSSGTYDGEADLGHEDDVLVLGTRARRTDG